MLDGPKAAAGISTEANHRLDVRARQVLSLDDFTEADVEALERARAPEASKVYDHELDR